MEDLINEIVSAYYAFGGWYGLLCASICILGFFITCKCVFHFLKALLGLFLLKTSSQRRAYELEQAAIKHVKAKNESFNVYKYDYKHTLNDD